jgi:hypothetical protein
VESTVNQLINWRSCKKQQMAWTKSRSAGPPPRQNRSAEWRFASLHATHRACRSSRLTPSFFMVPIAGVNPVSWYRSAETEVTSINRGRTRPFRSRNQRVS